MEELNSELDNGQLVSMPFKKSRSDTYLRLTWSSDMRQYYHAKCSQWYFMINGRECSSPASIVGNIYQYIDSPSAPHNNVHRHNTLVGVCRATSAGTLQSASYQISMNVRHCPFGFSPGAAHTGFFSTSTLMVEELCPPK